MHRSKSEPAAQRADKPKALNPQPVSLYSRADAPGAVANRTDRTDHRDAALLAAMGPLDEPTHEAADSSPELLTAARWQQSVDELLRGKRA